MKAIFPLLALIAVASAQGGALLPGGQGQARLHPEGANQGGAKLPYPVTRLLVVGDSITRHGPAEKLGWKGKWGMAATEEAKDFAHLLRDRLATAQGNAVELLVHAEGGGAIPGKLKDSENLRKMNADVVVIQMGENDNSDVTEQGFQKTYEELVTLLKEANPKAHLVCTGVWGKSAVKDRFVKAVCRKFRLPFADLTALQNDEKSWAKATGLWTHPGVGWHPSDVGMAGYAEAIFSALMKGDSAIPAEEKGAAPGAGPAVATESVTILAEDFEKPDAMNNWGSPLGKREMVGATAALRLTAPEKAGAMAQRTLKAADLAGHTIRVSARIKGENIEKPPKSYNGVKLMVILMDAEGAKDYPQAPAPSGTFDWTEISFTKKIPQNLATATLNVGLELVSGTLWVDDIKIETVVAKAGPTSRLLPPPAGPYEAKLVVDPGKTVGAVNPLLFGHNVEAADGMNIFGSKKPNPKPDGDGLWDLKNHRSDPTVMAFSKEIGVKVLRYPGGCLVHNYDWKNAVGPVESRPNYAFGVDEWVAWCREVGAEPLMNVAVYVGTPADKADLVEYCNAPATAKYPWAMKRAQWGHKEPYGIKYWEIGNEEDHGNHDVIPRQKFTADQYSDYFLECARLMKKIDPTIKMSVHMGTGTPPSDPWNAAVTARVKNKADFVAVHTYLSPGLDRWMGSPETAILRLREYRAIIKSNAGVDLPLAVTEYNVGQQTERFSWAAALFCGDYLRAMLDPKENILMANYWQFVRGYWGFLNPRPNGWIKYPAFYVYRLWNGHHGNRVVGSQLDCLVILPVVTNPVSNLVFSVPPMAGEGWACSPVGSGAFKVDLKGLGKELYPNLVTVGASPASTYLVRFEARFKGKAGTADLGLGLMDSRGWAATKSAIGIEGLELAGDWTAFSGSYTTLPDLEGVTLVGRFRGRKEEVAEGTLEIRNLVVERKETEGFPVCTAATTLSADGKTLHTVLFNKSSSSQVKLSISSAKANLGPTAKWWTVWADTILASSTKEEVAREIRSGESISAQNGVFTLTLEPFSMHAVDFSLR